MIANGLQRGTSVDLKNCVLFAKTRELATNGSLDVWMALKFGEGSLQHTIDKSYDYKMNRGKLDDIRRGPDQVLKVSFEGKFTNILSNVEGTEIESYSLHEILEGVEYGETAHGEPKFAGTREPWLTAFGCPPYCVDLEIHNNPKLDCPDSEVPGEAQLLRYFRATSIAANFQSGAISVSGECHILRPMIRLCVFGYSTEETAEPFIATDPWADDPRTPAV